MGEPTLPLMKPWLDEREADAARRVILSGWVTQGPETAAFEDDFAAMVKAPHACAASSCTAALHLVLVALGVGPDDEVITPTHSFIATANTIRMVGATPVFVDIEPATYNLDPSRVATAFTSRTKAVLCVHQMGMPCDLGALLELTAARKVPLIEDAACAAGSEIRLGGRWEQIGRPHGTAACFSFHPRKLVTAGEGGMVTTADAALDARIRRLRHQGMNLSDRVRHQSRAVLLEQYDEVGFNYRMTDLQAAVAREQLRRLPVVITQRRRLADRYRSLLAPTAVTPPAEPDWARSNWQSYCVRLPSGCNSQQVMQQMLDQGIATRPGIMCAHQEPAYQTVPWVEGAGGLAESERARAECLLLPLFHELTTADQERVVSALTTALAS